MQRRSWITTFRRFSSPRPAVSRLNYASIAPRYCYDAPRRCLSSDASALKLRFGQPTFETHPHLLKSGEVTPGCSALEYAMRRAKLASELPDGGLAICTSSYVKYRSGPVFYEFHQDPDFYYLTGFLEPEAVCVIEKTGPDGDHIFHMFVREKDDKAELWDGARSGVQAAVDVFNADEAGDVDHLHTHLAPLIEKAETIYADVNLTPRRPASVFSSLFSSGGPDSLSFASLLDGKRTVPLKSLMHKLRVFKSTSEVANMRNAGKISGRAFNMAMQNKFTKEKDLWAFLEYHFKVGGCENSAYVPVVAGGQNACTIHYTRNNDALRDGEMVLVDAGGQYGGYTTDITRTWPISGRFTPAQRDLYQAVLNIQKRCVALCREDAKISLDELHSVAELGLKDELKGLGFDVSGRAMEVLFPHHLGHFVGIDIHDSGSYSRNMKLKTSQCVTIEPGIYVPDDTRWPKHFRGMGVRIEDSVCVGEEGPIVLSVEAAKEVVDIEALGESYAQ